MPKPLDLIGNYDYPYFEYEDNFYIYLREYECIMEDITEPNRIVTISVDNNEKTIGMKNKYWEVGICAG